MKSTDRVIVEDYLEEAPPSLVGPLKALLAIPVPFSPRITKSTAVAAINTLFPTTEALLKRFNIAKTQANFWDGERDGLREVVKTLVSGTYGKCILTKTTGASVLYPNAEGKHQLENCLQTDIPSMDIPAGTKVTAYIFGGGPEAFLDAILHQLQTSKAAALTFLEECHIGSGQVVANDTLYKATASETATIVEL